MTQDTKIFGFRIPLNSKALIGILFGLALFLAWYNLSGSSDDHSVNVVRPAAAANTVSSPSAPALGQNIARRADLTGRAKQNTLHFKPVDPTREDVDPTLRLWLLERVRAVTPITGGRNLFETGPELAQGSVPPLPQVQKIIPKPLSPAPAPGMASTAPPLVNIPLRYYGFVKPSFRGDGNRGYFMDGENNILMATEGDLLKSQFLVVTLSPNVARVEDIQLKRGQDLQLIPEAIAQ